PAAAVVIPVTVPAGEEGRLVVVDGGAELVQVELFVADHDRVRHAVGDHGYGHAGHEAADHDAIGTVGATAGAAGVVDDVVVVVEGRDPAGWAVVDLDRCLPDGVEVGAVVQRVLLDEGEDMVGPRPLAAIRRVGGGGVGGVPAALGERAFLVVEALEGDADLV